MKTNIKKVIVFTFAVFFFFDLLNTLLTSKTQFFIYPSGSDYEIGKAMGANSFRIIEVVITFYALTLLRKIKLEKKS